MKPAIAWITPYPPDRNGGGGQIRQAYLLLGLAKKAGLVLVTPGPVSDPLVRGAVIRLIEVATPNTSFRSRHPWGRRIADVVTTTIRRRPLEVAAFHPYRRALKTAVNEVLADVTIVEYAGLAPLLPPKRSGQWLLTFHNLPSRMAKQQEAILPKGRQRWLMRRDATIAATFQQDAARAFDRVVVVSQEDADALSLPERTLVIPNGVDTGRFHATALPSAPRIAFTGALYTAPNVDGAIWLCREVLPWVRREVPEATVDLVGARPDREVSALSTLPGVSLHADVPDTFPFLQRARVATVPLRIGSGTRLKALEAMAAGRPVVGTAVGLEGLAVRDREHVLMADSPQAFGESILQLIRDEHLAADLAASGRRLVDERYSWTRIATEFTEDVLALLGASQRASEGSPDETR